MASPLPTAPKTPTARRRAPRHGAVALAAALAALVLLAAAVPAAQARSSATMFTITGRGWGHGIGMSQWGAYGYAKHGWTYKEILQHYYTGIEFGAVANDPIRVRLRGGLTSVKLTCAKPYTATQTGITFAIDAGVMATVTWVDGKYHVTAGDKSQDFTAPVTFTPSAGSLDLQTSTDLGTKGKFRGTLRVLRPDNAFMIVNKLPLESYLRGVVPHEVSPSWPVESLKAQACAARAYAQKSRAPNSSFDVYCTVRDQAYAGVSIEASATDKAVADTAGIVPTYKGAVISAFYFSCSGGHTENIENSWQTSAVPYLKGVVDKYDYMAPSYLHTWVPERHGAGTLANKLGSSVSGSLRAIYVVQRGVSPRIVKAAVVGSTGVQFLHGSILRAKLGLKDSWAFFRSMSISPAAGDHASIAPGGSIQLRGKLYQAAPKDATVTMHYYVNGAWHTRTIATTRTSEDLGSGYTAWYSAYSVTVKPAATATYYFTYGKASSPKTTITVTSSTRRAAHAGSAAVPPPQGSPTPAATPGATATPSAGPSPQS